MSSLDSCPPGSSDQVLLGRFEWVRHPDFQRIWTSALFFLGASFWVRPPLGSGALPPARGDAGPLG